MTIRTYEPQYENQLFELIESEGLEWEYWQEPYKQDYIKTFERSTLYLVFEGQRLCGYAKVLDDFVIWIVDLLVHQNFRGKEYGKLLMEHICLNFPQKDVYVLGGNDVLPYYKKLGYSSEGVVYKVNG